MNSLQTLQILMISMIGRESTLPGKDFKCNDPNAIAYKQHFLFESLVNSTDNPQSHASQSHISKSHDTHTHINTNTNKLNDIINNALTDSYEQTVNYIPILRNLYMMKLLPHILLVSALLHPQRVTFNRSHPNLMRSVIEQTAVTPSDMCIQFDLLKQSKKIPTIWKRTIAKKLENMTAHDLSDDVLKTNNVSLVDLIRITHPNGSKGSVVDELVRYGKIISKRQEKTHLQLLQELKPFLIECSKNRNEIEMVDKISKYGDKLVATVENGNQMPFKYYSVYRSLMNNFSIKTVKNINQKYIDMTTKALERCLKRSLSSLPTIEGRVDILSDNSESAQNMFTTPYGILKSSEISNLSAIFAGFRATDGGSIWIFGDRYEEYKIDKNESIFKQLDLINKIGQNVGCGESGLWLFWNNVLKEKRKLDNVFIYSDQQASYGHLYADPIYKYNMTKMDHDAKEWNTHNVHIDLLKIIDQYKNKINKKVNIISIQIAGYKEYMPNIMHRGIVCGWNGREITMMHHMNKYWILNESQYNGCDEDPNINEYRSLPLEVY